MQIKKLIFIGVLFVLNGCSSSVPKPEIIVIEKSINQVQTTDIIAVDKKFENTSSQAKVVKKKRLVNNNVVDKKDKIATKKAVKQLKKATVKPKKPKKWSFPVKAKVSKHFSKKHPGIVFDTELGQAVRAIDSGVVTYSGNKYKEYGKMVIIKHPLGFYSFYTQNRTLRVRRGDKVKSGKIIALTGKNDFYFELKKFETPINPLKYLK